MSNKGTEISNELLEILKEYKGNRKLALKEHIRLDYLYALSDQRENLLEWYPFRPEGTLLEVGSGYGAMTGVYSRHLAEVDVLDRSEKNLEVNRFRHVEQGGRKNIHYHNGELYQYALDCKKQYDYIVFVGTLDEDAQRQIKAAKELLKSEGELLVAVSNPFGVKYWAGTKKEPNSFSRTALIRLLSEKEDSSDVKFYYPMPDYRIPVTIFSDSYLPSKGDLTDQMMAYDYPSFLVLDVGASFDAVCGDGQFGQNANSYLAIWTKKERDNKLKTIEYIKYNCTRKEQFQIKTMISGKPREVEKSALTEEGILHIQLLRKNCKILNEQHVNLRFAWPEIGSNNKSARFPYLEGQTLSEKLGREIKDGKAPVEAVKEAMEAVLEANDFYYQPFEETQDFIEVFGKFPIWGGKKDRSLSLSNIDALFENILLMERDVVEKVNDYEQLEEERVTQQVMYCLDYEWVFSFPIPLQYIKYRILFYFFRQYRSLLTEYKEVGEWLKEFGIARADADIYEEMEQNFQEYVHGENQQIYLNNYSVDVKTMEELNREKQELEQELTKEKENTQHLRGEVEEKDITIHKITELQRLTQNHVANLEIMIGDLRHEIGEMAKTLAYLNRHEALIFKLRRKLGQKFNEKYPKGTIKRKKLTYLKEYILHPVRSIRLYSSEEGRNLKEGDLAIGSAYREHGKLKFSRTEQPLVSIIIPVYNQIHYTYDCLVSILEHTKDVAYEVIIADDVSTDGTKNLNRFTEGIVICRNTSNQGFLRNCNHAAKSARGHYLMFLNNDTKVTSGWLRSLVELIESDKSIGMVGSKLVYPDGRLQEAGGIIWSDGSGWNYGRLDNPDKPEYNYVKEVDYISGAAILLSNDLWKQIGGFDERFAPAYCEDSDLAFAVRKAGYRVVYQPLSKVIHFEGISNGTDVEGTGLKRYQVENSKKLKEKWAEEFARQCENNGNPDPFRARERSMGKPMILVVDHYVPTYDKDAGSKTTFQYLKMFVKKGYIVKFLGDNFLHEEPYSTTLQQMGIEILYGPEYQAGIWKWLSDHGHDIQFAYLNRPHIASNYIDYIKENTDMKIIYYGHDLHFLREGREYELTGNQERRKAALHWKSVEMSLMRKAAVSYYPSYVERYAIQELDEKIRVKDIVAYVYESFRQDIPSDFAKREGLLFVGGFAHPPNIDAVLWFVGEVYPLIRSLMENVGQIPPDFYIVGSKVTDEIKSLEQLGNGVVVKGFVTEEELARLYDTTRIVVVPLRYGAGVKGKVVEALYNGAAVVTTSIGAEGIAEAETVMMVEDEPELFARAVFNLYNSPENCQEMSRKTQEYIKEHYSIEAAWTVVGEDFC